MTVGLFTMTGGGLHLLVVLYFVGPDVVLASPMNATGSIENQFIVVFKDHGCDHEAFLTKVHAADTHHGRLPMSVLSRYRFGKFSAMRVRLRQTDIKTLRNDPEVKYVEVNRKIRLYQGKCASLEDGSCVQQFTSGKLWGMSRTGSRPKPNYSSASYTYLTGDGSGVDVYVVDTGVYEDHEEFEGRAKVAFIASDLIGQPLTDEHGHGTHVSGTIAGKTYGLAKSANILAVKVLGKDGVGTLGGLLEGLQWVQQDYSSKKATGRKGVVNMSLGGAPGEVQSLDEAAITLISQDGLPFVAAAGNDNTDACLVSPARLSVAVTVGAMDNSDSITSFSNFGPCVDILAPGDMILSASIVSTSASAIMTGTSMSAPHVTGVIARYLSQACERSPTPSTIKAWLQDTATADAVTLGTKLSTPNKLLYMFCLAGFGGPDPVPGDKEIPTGVDSKMFNYIYIALGVLAGLCLVLIIFAIATHKSLARVRQDIQKPIRQYYVPTSYNTFGEAPSGVETQRDPLIA